MHLNVREVVRQLALGEVVQEHGERLGHHHGKRRGHHHGAFLPRNGGQRAVPVIGVGEAGGLLVLPGGNDQPAVVAGRGLEELGEPAQAVEPVPAAHVVPPGALPEVLAQPLDDEGVGILDAPGEEQEGHRADADGV